MCDWMCAGAGQLQYATAAIRDAKSVGVRELMVSASRRRPEPVCSEVRRSAAWEVLGSSTKAVASAQLSCMCSVTFGQLKIKEHHRHVHGSA